MGGEVKGGGVGPSGADWSVLERYAKEEQARVEAYKNELVTGRPDEDGNWQSPEEVRQDFLQEKSEREPSVLRKLGRMVLETVNFELVGSQVQRNREAMAKALEEHDDELVEREMAKVEAGLAENVQGILAENEVVREAEDKRRLEAEAWENDRENRERDLAEGMEMWRNEKHEKVGRERAQEILERKLDERLTKVEGIREQAEAGNPEVGRRTLDYMGKEVEVFDLKGLPFAMLSHAVDYRLSGKDYVDRDKMAKIVVEHPEVWARNRESIKEATDGTEKLNAETLSTSYTNSESNIDNRMGPTSADGELVLLCYGFDHVGGNSVLKVSVGDAMTPEKLDDTEINEDSLNFLEEAEGSGRSGSYNEVALRRYLENGEARKPDYIIAENGKITDAMLKHAAYFGVPILNIERPYYSEKFAERVEGILGTVDDESSFREVENAVGEIGGMADYVRSMRTVELYGGGNEQSWWEMKEDEIARQPFLDDETKGKMMHLLELEAEKRLEFVEQKLGDEAEQYQEAVEGGRKHEFQSDFLEDFRVEVYADGKRFSENGVEDGVKMMNGDRVDISMKMKKDGREIKTFVYLDGEGNNKEQRDSLALRALEYLKARWQYQEMVG